MRRPLQELPILQFLPAIQDMHGRNNKRPLSPGGTAIISPSKRRNLAAHDIFSPERTFKSPPSSLRKSIASASRFTDVLAGPQSPAKILDFGVPKHLAGDPEKRPVSDSPLDHGTPTRRQPSSSRLAPSPELKPPGVRSRRAESDDVFTTRPDTSSRCSYTLVPRELPPRSDPQSVHYPGFIVYQDPHVAAYDSLPCEDDGEGEDDDEESWKENSRVAVTKNLATPRSSSFPKAFLDGDKSPSSTKFKPISSVRMTHANLAGSSSAAVFKKNAEKTLEGKKNSRRILLDELDYEEDCVTEE